MHINPAIEEADTVESVTLKLTRLPQYKNMSEFAYRELIKALTNDMISEIDKPTKVLGQKRILNQRPLSMPTQSSKTPAPLCHTTCVKRHREFRNQLNALTQAYKEAYQHLKESHFRQVFPEGSIPPTAWAT